MKKQFEFGYKTEDYNPKGVETYWQDVWERNRIYEPNIRRAKRPFYNLNEGERKACFSFSRMQNYIDNIISII